MFEELHPDICAVVQGRRACCGSFGVCGREVRVLSPWWEEIRWGLSKNPNDPNDFLTICNLSHQLACLPQREFLGQGSLRELLMPGEKGQVCNT